MLGGGKCFSGSTVEQYVKAFLLFLKEQRKYQVLLYGGIDACVRVKALLNHEKVHVLGVVQDVCETLENSDYVIVCEAIDAAEAGRLESIRRPVIVRYDLISHFALKLLPEFQFSNMELQKRLKDRARKTEGAVFGLSYQRYLDYEKLQRNLVCMAVSSHDIFLDYQKLLWLYEILKKHGETMRYCVLGMDFYRLWYDLSMSGYRVRIMSMYHHLHCVHHFHELDALLPKYRESLQACGEIMTEDYLGVDFLNHYSQNEFGEIPEKIYRPTKEAYENDAQTITDRVFHKPYPHTFIENTGILERLFRFCALHEIKVLVYIPPFPEIFNRHTAADMKEATWQVLNDLQAKYDFDLLDLSDHAAFQRQHFSDSAHLNRAGAELATEILNRYMGEIWQ